jgi:IclR family acetate operon transcriptional repressor
MVTRGASRQHASGRTSGGVQSLERSFGLLEIMADGGGVMTLSDLAAVSSLPLPTVHRLIRTLVDAGYVRQEPSRRYALGPRLIRLGESASRMLSQWARPHLSKLVDEIGETANLAVLDGDDVVYVAQAPSRHSMRMFTEVGRRVLPHSSGVGKALLAQLPDDQVEGLLARTGMPAYTTQTITSPRTLIDQLARIREIGYALDEGEHEVGVRCVAVHVPEMPTPTGISISGPAARVTDDLVKRAVLVLQRAADSLANDINDDHLAE